MGEQDDQDTIVNSDDTPGGVTTRPSGP
jgi:hypothetical protein